MLDIRTSDLRVPGRGVSVRHPNPGQRGVAGRNMAFFNQPGVFTTLLGWEYTLDKDPENDPPGKVLSHRSVLFPGTEREIHTWYKKCRLGYYPAGQSRLWGRKQARFIGGGRLSHCPKRKPVKNLHGLCMFQALQSALRLEVELQGKLVGSRISLNVRNQPKRAPRITHPVFFPIGSWRQAPVRVR